MNATLVATFSERDGPKLLMCTSAQAALAGEAWYSTQRSGAVYYSAPTATKEYASAARFLCVRALSSESVGPDREGKVVFGQQGKTFALCYVFHVYDVEARGMQRQYTLVFTHADCEVLMGGAAYIGAALRELAAELRAASKKVFCAEHRRRVRQVGSADYQDVSSWGAAVPMPAPRTRELRTLAELLNDPHVMPALHARLSGLLHALAARPVVNTASPCIPMHTLDAAVDPSKGRGDGCHVPGTTPHTSPERSAPMNVRQPHESSPFPQVRSISVGEEVHAATSPAPHAACRTLMQDTVAPSPSGSFSDSRSSQAPSRGGHEEDTARRVLLHDIRAALIRGPSRRHGDVLSGPHQPVGQDAFPLLIFHLAAGDQVVVTSDSRATTVAAVHTLAQLLPKTVRKCQAYSEKYVPGYECNLLGLPRQAWAAEVGHELPDGCVHLALAGAVRDTVKPRAAALSRNSALARLLRLRKAEAMYPAEVDQLAAANSPLETLQAARLQLKYWRVALLYASYAMATRHARAFDLSSTQVKKALALVSVVSPQPAADAAIFRFMGVKPRLGNLPGRPDAPPADPLLPQHGIVFQWLAGAAQMVMCKKCERRVPRCSYEAHLATCTGVPEERQEGDKPADHKPTLHRFVHDGFEWQLGMRVVTKCALATVRKVEYPRGSAGTVWEIRPGGVMRVSLDNAACEFAAVVAEPSDLQVQPYYFPAKTLVRLAYGVTLKRDGCEMTLPHRAEGSVESFDSPTMSYCVRFPRERLCASVPARALMPKVKTPGLLSKLWAKAQQPRRCGAARAESPSSSNASTASSCGDLSDGVRNLTKSPQCSNISTASRVRPALRFSLEDDSDASGEALSPAEGAITQRCSVSPLFAPLVRSRRSHWSPRAHPAEADPQALELP